MSSRRKSLPPRDQATTTFSGALLRLCESTGALAAALVDAEGETVDYAGYLDPFALRVMAAEWRIVLDVIRSVPRPGFQDAHEFSVRAKRKSFALIALSDGYALVLELPLHSLLFSRRALGEAAREIEQEAGLSPSRRSGAPEERWSKVEVKTVPGDPRRPEAVWIDGAWCGVTVLGRYVHRRRSRREDGYRARLENGLEIALIREPLGLWFAGGL
ncbi:MAG TPA: hypothetical protein VGK73_26360 [Polyangiaceae bacterium]